MKALVFMAALLALFLGSQTGCSEDVTIHSLAGTSWLVEDIDNSGVIDFAQTTVSFSREGTVSGSTGCNQYSGPVAITGSNLVFGPLINTLRACPEAVSDQEVRFLQGLDRAHAYRIDERGLLFLFDAEGEQLMRLSRTQ